MVLYFTLTDAFASVVVVLSALSILMAYRITRISRGAPEAWYVIIAAFVARFVYTVFILYVDILTPADTIDPGQTEAQMVTNVLFLVGLYMLDRAFMKAKLAQEA